MNESILELLQKVTLYDLIWSLLLIIAVIGMLISQKKRISGWMNKWRKDKNHKEDFNNLVYELKDSLAGISKIVNDQSVEMNNLKNEINNLKQEIINVHEKDSKTYKSTSTTMSKIGRRTYILAITLNVNRLTTPTRRHRLAEWI